MIGWFSFYRAEMLALYMNRWVLSHAFLVCSASQGTTYPTTDIKHGLGLWAKRPNHMAKYPQLREWQMKHMQSTALNGSGKPVPLNSRIMVCDHAIGLALAHTRTMVAYSHAAYTYHGWHLVKSHGWFFVASSSPSGALADEHQKETIIRFLWWGWRLLKGEVGRCGVEFLIIWSEPSTELQKRVVLVQLSRQIKKVPSTRSASIQFRTTILRDTRISLSLLLTLASTVSSVREIKLTRLEHKFVNFSPRL